MKRGTEDKHCLWTFVWGTCLCCGGLPIIGTALGIVFFIPVGITLSIWYFFCNLFYGVIFHVDRKKNSNPNSLFKQRNPILVHDRGAVVSILFFPYLEYYAYRTLWRTTMIGPNIKVNSTSFYTIFPDVENQNDGFFFFDRWSAF